MAVQKRVNWDWDVYDPRDALLMRVADNRGVRRRKRIKSFKQLVTYFIVLALMLLLLTFAGWKFYAYAITSPYFDIKSVVINDTNFLDKEALDASIASIKGRNIFLVDLNQIQEMIKANPWVDHCFIKRVLPDRLMIEIVEEKPAALLRMNGDLHLISWNAKLLNKYDSRRSSKLPLPLIANRLGFDINDLQPHLPLVMEAIQVIKSSYPQILRQIKEFDISEENHISLRLTGSSFYIKLGRNNFNQRIANLVLVLPKIKDRLKELDYIDLRFDHQVILHQAIEGR